MKKTYLFLALIVCSLNIAAQAPFSFKYQAIIRNNDGTVKSNETIALQVDILQGSTSGSSVYLEIHNISTNSLGLISVNIGDGTTSDDLTSIDWGSGPYFLNVIVNGISLGATQLLSVPYAIYANSAEMITGEIDYTESDPEYTSSVASNITSSDIVNWNSKLDSAELIRVLDSLNVPTEPINVSSLEGGPENYVLSVSNGVVQWRSIDEVLSSSTVNFPNIGGVDIARTSLIYATVESEVLPSAGTISSYGFAWSDNENPTINDDFITVGNGLGSFSYEISGLEANSSYYVRSWATNEHGIKYSDNVPFTTDSVPSVGDPWEGGIVFYTSGNTGLIAQETKISGQWFPNTSTLVGASSSDGFVNTQIMATAGSPLAIVATNSSIGGFTDWYIPSQNEFSTLIASLESARLPGFGGTLWSSTEVSSSTARAFWGTGPSWQNLYKTASLEAWLIRKFTTE